MSNSTANKTARKIGFKIEAVARIAADSKYWLWINGKIVVWEGGLKRGPTPRDTYCDEVDLAPHLQVGENVIAVLLWHFGKDGFAHNDSGRAGLLLDCQAEGFQLLSDHSWKVLRHPAHFDTGPPQRNTRCQAADSAADDNSAASPDVHRIDPSICSAMASFQLPSSGTRSTIRTGPERP